MKKYIRLIVLSFLIPLFSMAGEFSAEALVGEWVFNHMAEVDTPDKKRNVKLPMEFKANGEVITKKSKEDVIEHYEVKKNTIIYKGKYGKQVWKIISFDSDKGFVVNQMGMLMTFEKH